MADISKVRTLEQGRASQAYDYVRKAKEKGVNISKDYKSYVKKLPVVIKTNGLGQTLAFIKSKQKGEADGNAYNLIYKQLGEWLKDCPNAVIPKNGDDLIEAVINLSSQDYRVATSETLALLNWMRRFADGMIEGEGGES